MNLYVDVLVPTYVDKKEGIGVEKCQNVASIVKYLLLVNDGIEVLTKTMNYIAQYVIIIILIFVTVSTVNVSEVNNMNYVCKK